LNAHVLVPLKRLGRAKSRLAEALTAAERAALMVTLLERVVAAVQEAGVDRITLVTSESLAHDGAATWHDGDLPWNEALARAIAEVVDEELVAVISADLPFLQASDVTALIEATPVRGLAVGRAFDAGTNAVSMRPPGVLPTRFGEPGSAALHAASAGARGLECVTLDLPGLAFDVDTPADLERMNARARTARRRRKERV
jgi:2-phospho-L-lactate/phosphoenolpyruvate guanylyltransferase